MKPNKCLDYCLGPIFEACSFFENSAKKPVTDQKQKLDRSFWVVAGSLAVGVIFENHLRKREKIDAMGTGLGIPDLATTPSLEAPQDPC